MRQLTSFERHPLALVEVPVSLDEQTVPSLEDAALQVVFCCGSEPAKIKISNQKSAVDMQLMMISLIVVINDEVHL